MPPNPKPRLDALRRRIVGTDLEDGDKRVTSVTPIVRRSMSTLVGSLSRRRTEVTTGN